MKEILKYGGLALSGLLTLALFLDLFGFGLYGIVMAVAGLALFEVGAYAWSNLYSEARERQRLVVRIAMWFCVVSSILSSGAEIILSTRLWTPAFDIHLVTLMVIVGALAFNIIGVFAYEQLDPSRSNLNREMDRAAKARSKADSLEDNIVAQSLMKAEASVNEVAGEIAQELADELRGDVLHHLLSQTRGGSNRQLPAPVRRSVPVPPAAFLKAEQISDPSAANGVGHPKS